MLLVDHVRCAALNRPSVARRSVPAAGVGDVLDLLADERALHEHGDLLFWSGESYRRGASGCAAWAATRWSSSATAAARGQPSSARWTRPARRCWPTTGRSICTKGGATWRSGSTGSVACRRGGGRGRLLHRGGRRDEHRAAGPARQPLGAHSVARMARLPYIRRSSATGASSA